MTSHDLICVSYHDAAILAAGVVASWIAVYLWARKP